MFAHTLRGIAAMMARRLIALMLLVIAASGGCCCFPGRCGPGGEYGGGCCFCLPRPIIWTGECSECGPGHHRSCGDSCGECGLLPWLMYSKTCGKGCGEIYWGEWVSDPPDCCDPCDQCYGHWTGAHGPCCLGPCQRILAALHGYSYCPAPDCGPSCGLFCGHRSYGPACGCGHCGGGGCATCGGGAHGASINYHGPVMYDGDMPHPANPHGILDENWDPPKATPEPGKPIHKAQQPLRTQTTRVVSPAKRIVRSPQETQQASRVSREVVSE
jgi:hypothetical protein